MNKNYVLVTKRIKEITSEHIEFWHEGVDYTSLRKRNNFFHKGKVPIWKLSPEGVLVHKEYARAYKLA